MTTTTLNGQAVLAGLHDPMVARLVAHHGVSLPMAERMVGALWQRWTARVQRDPEFHQHHGALDADDRQRMAERIMDAAVAYWQLCAAGAGGYGPSPLVDIGVHTGHLYTMEFDAFSHALAGRFLHHCPTDVPGVDYSRTSHVDMAAALAAHGLPVDTDLWSPSRADCGGRDCIGGDCGDYAPAVQASCGSRDCTGGDCTSGGPAVLRDCMGDDWNSGTLA